jgi:hypothetical protein
MTDDRNTTKIIRVFYSYSHEDENHRKELEKHLTIMKRQGFIETWFDRKILPGHEFSEEIDDNLENSNIVLFLVSSSFLSSNYCYDREMKKALKMAEEDILKVIPIILRPCAWKQSPLGKLKALPEDGKPVVKWDDYDEAWLDIENGIRRVVEDINQVKCNNLARVTKGVDNKETQTTEEDGIDIVDDKTGKILFRIVNDEASTESSESVIRRASNDYEIEIYEEDEKLLAERIRIFKEDHITSFFLNQRSDVSPEQLLRLLRKFKSIDEIMEYFGYIKKDSGGYSHPEKLSNIGFSDEDYQKYRYKYLK